jgi:adenylate cyclase
MPGDELAERRRPGRGAVVVALAAVITPLLLLGVLRTWPHLDLRWDNQPAHFWLVLAASAIATALGYTVTVAARRRRDARLLIISLAFLSGAGFLGLHALATPGVLMGPNAGFELATPVGLVIGSVFVAFSAVEFRPERARRVMARSKLMLRTLVALILVWGVVSVAEVPPLDEPLTDDSLLGWQLILAVVGFVGYGAGSIGYLRLYRRRRTRFVFTVAVAFALLAVTMVVIAFAANWRISWWEWHVLMLVAFGLIGAVARQQWHEERFSDLYLDRTLAGTTEASILFADMQGFTTYSGSTPPLEVQGMVKTYFSRLVPLMVSFGGEVHQLIGDAIMVVFNKQGDQPGHAVLAARAALAFQREAAEIADANPEWPRFRVGVNSGEVVAGVLGDDGHRKHDVIGDTVNLAARLESAAPVGQVVIGEGTRDQLPDEVVVEELPELQVKGKAEPVTAYLLRDLP